MSPQAQEITVQLTTAARKYCPVRVDILLLCESPPYAAEERKRPYFFFESNPGSDVLFATVVAALYGEKYQKDPGRKAALLNRMKDDGVWLMDAVEEPINWNSHGKIKERDRNRIILAHFPDLLDRLKGFREDGKVDDETKLVLVKKNVCELLAERLREEGYKVVNRRAIGFPGYYRDRRTVRGIREALGMSGACTGARGNGRERAQKAQS